MIRRLYTALLALAAPVFWLLLWRRSRREGGQWQILAGERFGRYPGAAPASGAVWVHAVSLGETRAAKPLLDALLAQGATVLLTHTTATARAESSRLFAAELASGRLLQAWLPYDFPWAVGRFLRHYRPRLGVLIEREVWPNLVAGASAAGVPLALVSARLSAASAATMARLRPLMAPAFAALDPVLAQTADDAARLARLGAAAPVVMGNLKFDLRLPESLLAQGKRWRNTWLRPVVAIASTRDGEEVAFVRTVAAARSLPDNPLFLLIPRHPQRFDDVAAILAAAGAPYVRRSALAADARVPQQVRWVLGDTVGEMPAYYAASDVAIIGGSFADFGGQNLIEACAAGAPVIVGPYTRNFAQATEDALAAGAALRVPHATAAIIAAQQLIEDEAHRGRMAQAAGRFVAAHRGATQRAMAALAPWL